MTTQMSCEQVIAKLFEYLDRDLDEAAQRDIERHLQACRGCFTRAEFERRLRDHVARAAEVEAPEALRARVRRLTARF